MTVSLLTVRQLSLSCGVKLDLEIGCGQRMALLGGEACGKSRFGRMLVGLVVPESGEVVWHGEARGRAMLFRVPDWHFLTATPWEEVALTPAASGQSDVAWHQQVVDSLTWAGVSVEAWHGSLMHLSASERYRVSMAVVHSMQPQLLILDEPGHMLSDQGEEQLAQALVALGVATFTLTSRIARARRFADQIMYVQP
ncbi:MAG: ATP-binding cassette domain-containing protein [Magnetococcales bacterium]|nr:ATP-binding cassette domain-containing protein [Magnetococcales bacterium]